MSAQKLILEINGPIASLIINRPEVHNAFDDEIITLLSEHLTSLKKNKNIRVVILKSIGSTFSAGADLNWMQQVAHFTKEENIADAETLAKVFKAMDELPQLTIASIQGAAFGGALGLITCCDIAIATKLATFCFSEVRLGIAPAMISPYVIRAIGLRYAKRYLVTAEPFDATQAQQLGLIHEVVTEEALDVITQKIADRALKNGPNAMFAAKQVVQKLANAPENFDSLKYTTEMIAKLRTSHEGQEGLKAFLEKRKPDWHDL